MRLKIKGWSSFQHYKDRCPPWIKLHFKILHSKDWVSAGDSDRVLAIACMLIASQDNANDGSFDADPDYIMRVAYLNTRPDFKALIKLGFLESVSDASECYQTLEICTTETEEETEKERETDSASAPADNSAKVSVTANDLVKTYGIDKDMAAQWLAVRKDKRMKLTPLAMDKTIAECKKAGITLSAAVKLCCENSWAGFKAEYLANLPQSESPQAADPLVAERKELKYERQQLYADIRQLEALSLPIPADKRRRLSAVEERLREIGN